MANHVYRSTEITGSSPEGVTEAIEIAIERASRTLRNLDWFEVTGCAGRSTTGRSLTTR
jgi:flavin-binding protein dodecin